MLFLVKVNEGLQPECCLLFVSSFFLKENALTHLLDIVTICKPLSRDHFLISKLFIFFQFYISSIIIVLYMLTHAMNHILPNITEIQSRQRP